MSMFSYVFLRIRNSWSSTLTTLLTYISILSVIASIQSSVQTRQHNLEAMQQAVRIEGELQDPTGNTSTGLNFDKYFAALFLDSTYFLYDMVEDVSVLASFPGFLPEEEKALQIKGISHPKADEGMYLNGSIRYETGYDDSVWLRDQMACAIPYDMLDKTHTGSNGLQYIQVTGSFFRSRYQDYVTIPFYLQVVGITMMRDTVYMPYTALKNACSLVGNITFNCSALSFTIRDNRDLERFRARATHYFNEQSLENTGSETLTLVLKDSQYLKFTRETEKNLAIMQLMQPILYLCALGAGVMLVVMQMRSRKKEMAVIRSLGAGRLRVMAQSILEYALICLPVTLFALIVWRELSPMTVFGVWLSFMAGALCTIVRFSAIPLVRQIRELEE